MSCSIMYQTTWAKLYDSDSLKRPCLFDSFIQTTLDMFMNILV